MSPQARVSSKHSIAPTSSNHFVARALVEEAAAAGVETASGIGIAIATGIVAIATGIAVAKCWMSTG
eukprot:s1042_g1.t1